MCGTSASEADKDSIFEVMTGRSVRQYIGTGINQSFQRFLRLFSRSDNVYDSIQTVNSGPKKLPISAHLFFARLFQ
jgi:hypothetical protein